MTINTRAATDDILDIFNQPLRNVDPMAGPPESDGEIDYDDDDYTSGGESTGTGRISGTSDFGDTEPSLKDAPSNEETVAESASPWSDFTASKHVPKYSVDDEEEKTTGKPDEHAFVVHEDSATFEDEKEEEYDIVTPISYEPENEPPRTRYVPIPPEDYEPPARLPRDPAMVAQNKLPFMTPIVEKTETSLGALSIRTEKDYFNSKTPSRDDSKGLATPLIDGEPLSSPFQEIINESRPARVPKLKMAKDKPNQKPTKDRTDGPIINDMQCNPVDESIRNMILEHMQPPISSYPGYHDHRPQTFNKAPEIRKFINALKKPKGSDKTTTAISLPPTLRFPFAPSTAYTIKRELGKGAFAPVYLAEASTDSDDPSTCPSLIAIKCEHPPTAWEYHIMRLLQLRLPSTARANPSLLPPHSLHLFADEAYLLESYLDQGTLLDLVNTAKADPSGQTTLDESVAMFFTIELLRTVEAMHSVGILHGDLKADNCLVRLSPSPNDTWDPTYSPTGANGWAAKGLTLIDFGRSIDTQAFHPRAQFIADWPTTKQDCPEMRALRPWTYQVDYWGVAGVVHNLLFGKYIEDVAVPSSSSSSSAGDAQGLGLQGVGERKRYKLKEALKRYWQTELWGMLFETLLNPPAVPCAEALRACRERMEGWLGGEGGRRNGGLRGGLRRVEERIRERRGR